MAVKECPMCGERMRQREQQITARIPGTSETRTSSSREWICPECDYFEEVEE